jgi:hypothetical protein
MAGSGGNAEGSVTVAAGILAVHAGESGAFTRRRTSTSRPTCSAR